MDKTSVQAPLTAMALGLCQALPSPARALPTPTTPQAGGSRGLG